MIPLVKTKKGTRITRPLTGVGKFVGSQLYVHRDYIFNSLPKKDKEENTKIISSAFEILKEKFPKHQFKCIMFERKTKTVRFDEAPDFDEASEPIPGKTISIFVDGRVKESYVNSIWHHKWLWVEPDYKGFDVNKAHLWSYVWAKNIDGIAKASKKTFKKQLIDAITRLEENNKERAIIIDMVNTYYKY